MAYTAKLTPDFDNPKWIGRLRCVFSILDKNQNGLIALDEIIQSSFEFCASFEATPEQTKRFQIAVEKFFRQIGLDYGKQVYFPEYIEGWKRLATSDLELWAQNQRTVIQDLADSVFDMLDKDGNGGISLEEWARRGSMFGIFPSGEDAERSFRKCDLDTNGKLGVAEMTRQNLAFWYTTVPSADGLYGTLIP